MASKRVDEIITKILDHPSFLNNDGELPAWSSKIWKSVTDSININAIDGQKYITSQYLYTLVKENRYNILTSIRTKLGFNEEPNIFEQISDDNAFNSSSTSDGETELLNYNNAINRKDKQTKSFKVVIPYEKFRNIEPKEKKFRTKKGKKLVRRLQNGWTDVFFDALWDQHKLPCCFTISYHKVTEDYISFKGKCIECLAMMFGNIDELPKSNSDIILNILTIDTKDIPHTKKRFLKGSKRNEVGKDLMSINPSQWQRNAADQTMDYGDVEPPNLYSSSVLRKAKQQATNLELGISNENNPIFSIGNLKYSNEHQGAIQNIGFDPFFVHYWTPTQEHIYKTYRRTKWTTQYIDATGSLVLPIIRTQNKMSSHIFLYQIVVEMNGKTVSISQQLSEKQNITSIYLWLRCFMDCGMQVPNEIVCDYSKALLGAISRAYCNQQTIKEYIDNCFSYLCNHVATLPKTFIRIDVAHIIHMICRWKCLNGRKEVKDFYVRCVGLLLKSTNMKEFEKKLNMILTVALSEMDGLNFSNKQPSPSEIARLTLSEYIATGEIVLDVVTDDDVYKGINDNDEFYISEFNISSDNESQIYSWIEYIYSKSKDEASIRGDRLNALYCPGIVKPLLAICREFPLWTGVLLEHFNSPNKRGSSARIESYFANLKTSILSQKTSKMRADKFIVTHLRAIRGDIKMAQSNLQCLELHKENANNEDFLNEKQLSTGNIKILKNGSQNINTKIRHFDSSIIKKKKENNYNIDNNKNEVYNETHKNDTSINKQKTIQILTTESDDDENKINYDLMISSKYLEKYEDADEDYKINLKSNLFAISSSDSSLSENDITTVDKNVIKTTLVNLEEQEGNTVENWRNKGDKKNRRSLYLDNHPEIRIKNKKITNMKGKRQIDIARNGTLLRPITVNKRKICVLNTCPVDSILQILATSIIDSVLYANFAKASECDIMELAYYLAMNGTNMDFYKKRISIVEKYTKSNVEQYTKSNVELVHVIQLDAKANTNILVEKLFIESPSITQFNTCSNHKCGQTVTGLPLFPIDLMQLAKGSFNNMQDAITMYPSQLAFYKRPCLRDGCKGTQTITKTLGHHIIIETVMDTIDSINTLICYLNDVSEEISIENNKYRLTGITAFIEPNGLSGIGHYIAYIKRLSGQWEQHDDLTRKVRTIKDNMRIVPHTIFYIKQ